MNKLFLSAAALALTSRMCFAAEDGTGSAEAPAPAAETKPKVERVTQNGVTQPAEGTKTRQVWDIATELSTNLGRPALRDEVMKEAEAAGMNRGTIATQYGKWCTFYDVSVESRKSARAENREASEAEKKAAKEAAKNAAPAAEADTSAAPAAPDLASQVSGVEDDGEE